MGKLFGRKKKYSEDEYENEEFDDEIDDEDEDLDEDETEEEDSDEDEIEDDNPDEDEMDDDDPDEEEDDPDEDEEDDDEWDEDDRRAYRRRRRIRNQIIVYSVVFVFLAAVIGGCIWAGRSIVDVVKQKKLAEEQQALEEEQQRLQEEQEAHDVVIDTPETLEEEPEEEPEEDYLGEIVNAYISEMPLTDKVAGLFIDRKSVV